MNTRTSKILIFCLISILLTGCFRRAVKIEPKITPLSDYQSNDGKISIKIQGGKKPYSILWSNNKSDTLLTGLKAGFYFVSVTDARGKTFVDTFEVTQPAWPICVDFEGNNYKTAIIDSQIWMVENLRVSVNKAGKPISYFQNSDTAKPNIQSGYLYTWKTAMDSMTNEGVQGICPDGWHLPTDKEWSALTKVLDDITDRKVDTIVNPFNLVYTGFYNQSLQNVGTSASFWSSTQAHDNAWKRYFHKKLSKSFRYHEVQTNAISVRCIKDK
jgi:uncharacterized protein (TIGR02145 family)